MSSDYLKIDLVEGEPVILEIYDQKTTLTNTSKIPLQHVVEG